MFILNLYGA